MTDPLDQALLYLTDLRVKVRGNPEATAIVDRCLALLTAMYSADAMALPALEVEFAAIHGELERRFGTKAAPQVH